MEFTDTQDERELELSKEYRCRVCKDRYKTVAQLRNHLQTKHQAARFACQKCKYSSDRKGNLIRHVETSHQSTNKSQASSESSHTPKKGEATEKKKSNPIKATKSDAYRIPKVQREVLPQYAPNLTDLLACSPLEPRRIVKKMATTPQSPNESMEQRNTEVPKEISCESANEISAPDPRLFQKEAFQDEGMTEIAKTMEKAREEARTMPAGKTSCEWRIVKMTERKTYVVTTETAVKDGFYFRRVREEHLE